MTEIKKIRNLEVVLKIAGRCNINCTYCYMFNKGNDDYMDQPVYMSECTLDSVLAYLLEGIAAFGVEQVFIIFHGGEPMMMRKEMFETFCIKIKSTLQPHLKSLIFQIQTNGTLVTPAWLKLFSKQKVSVGVSLDGPEEYNDIGRIDHQGRGTYQKTLRGIRLIQNASHHGILNDTGLIAVINGEHSGRRIYRHFVDELAMDWMSFLMPMDSHDSFDPTREEAISNYLLEVFDEWVKDDNPHITVRSFDHFFNFLTRPASARDQAEGHVVIIPLATNGDVSVDDESKPVNFGQAIQNVATSTLADHVASESYQHMQDVMDVIPQACQECEWVGYCRGGAQNQNSVNRYSRAAGFNNKSIYCESYKILYSKMAAYLLRRGLTEDRLVDALYESAEGLTFSALPEIRNAGLKRVFKLEKIG